MAAACVKRIVCNQAKCILNALHSRWIVIDFECPALLTALPISSNKINFSGCGFNQRNSRYTGTSGTLLLILKGKNYFVIYLDVKISSTYN